MSGAHTWLSDVLHCSAPRLPHPQVQAVCSVTWILAQVLLQRPAPSPHLQHQYCTVLYCTVLYCTAQVVTASPPPLHKHPHLGPGSRSHSRDRDVFAWRKVRQRSYGFIIIPFILFLP